MKQYIAFAFETDESGGWNDVVRADMDDRNSPALSFDSIEEAERTGISIGANIVGWQVTVQVVDLHQGGVVKTVNSKDNGQTWKVE